MLYNWSCDNVLANKNARNLDRNTNQDLQDRGTGWVALREHRDDDVGAEPLPGVDLVHDLE